ncbi:MAG: TonB-dependent receptor plug domain-containing protein [Pseudohongiella sp.]|nr:TonB-dependent receptor plug domain-containing protein [Pseudohongiella sp.]
MTRRLCRQFIQLSTLSLAIATASQSLAQADVDETVNESTVVYKADFFAEYSPVSVNDMINRIPGIGLALNNRGGGNSRGLGSGEGEVLINGQRTTGKSNEGRSQLSRISADQVDYIEIIRGTSEEMDIRGGGQVVNIVLLDSRSRSNISAEVNMDRYRDGTLDPGGNLSFTGQTGDLNYLFHIEAEPRYNNQFSNEISRDASGNILETRNEENIRDQTDFQTSFNLGYQFEKSMIQFNGLYGESKPPSDVDRIITDFSSGTAVTATEREDNQSDRNNWEIGGDYEYRFDKGGKYRFLFIVNDRKFANTRERFDVFADSEEKDLFLFSAGRDRERIARTSYTWDLASNQGVELGVELAQTIRDSDLRLGVQSSTGTPSAAFGGLVPVDINNASSSVEEIRYENFAVHNWQLNDRMSLESSLIYETSTITQRGDVNNKRDFNFLRPKLDYRFDLTQSLQFRATVKKDVSQLSFSDFSASTDNSDDDQDTQAGNPDIAQEQSWSYEANLEYRLPNNVGVLNSSVYYRDIKDVIDRIDVSSSPTDLQSARGNIGDAERYGINLDASIRLGYIGLPSALLSVGLSAQDSAVIDPFLGTERRLRHNGRWFGRANFRHDITQYDLSYGFNYFNSAHDGSGLTQIDIIDIEREIGEYGVSFFLEKKAFDGITFRFDIQNANNQQRCRERTRFVGATIAGIVEEIEDSCSGSGVKYALKIRHTF